MKSFSCAVLILAFALTFLETSCAENNKKDDSNKVPDQEVKKTDRIQVKGKAFVNESGNAVVFHGVNIADPARLERDSLWHKSHFEEAKEWGANMIRLPIHPVNWNVLGPDRYQVLLDSAVSWAKDLDIYLIMEWHSIGNLSTGNFQHPMYETDVEQTHEFWNRISLRYGNEPVVAMFELFNEPVGGRFEKLNWETWKPMNLEMIQVIRKNAPETVILVAGFNWAYDLSFVGDDPIDLPNIAYVSHPYPEKRKQPWEEQWEKDWGYVADSYPVILTEIGYALDTEPGVHIPVHGDENYGNAIVNYTRKKGISWVVWCFDAKWSPLMYQGDYEPTSQGKFFKEIMQND